MALDRDNWLITGENICGDSRMVEDGFTVRDCNLSQAKAHTPIFEGVKGLIFEGCNLKNCDLPEDAIVKDCLQCHEDVVVETLEQAELAQKKMKIELQVLESFRTDIKAEIITADMRTATMETIRAAVVESEKMAVSK